ncbi:MAG: leucine-rich repeat protein [Lachnospiraceae bacterium]
MNRIKLVISCIVACIILFATTDVKASQKEMWNYDKQIVETEGAYTYHAYLSSDEKEVWIYKITIDGNKDYTTLLIPKKLGDRKVTRLGYAREADHVTKENDEYYLEGHAKSLFDEYVDRTEKWDGGTKYSKKIKKISIPDSVEVIQPATFGGMDKVTEITIPKKVTSVESDLFYGCDNLKTINLPAGVKKIDVSSMEACSKLKNMNIPLKNKYLQVKNQCILDKRKKALLYILGEKKKLAIPEGVKIIRKNACGNCKASVVSIPASVTKIEDNAFEKPDGYGNNDIKNITVSKKNRVYARDGQCIYNKKDKSLSVAIPNKKRILYISEKVQYLKDMYSVVNFDSKKHKLKKVVYPKTLKGVEDTAFFDLSQTYSIYFMGTKPPKIKKIEGKVNDSSVLPSCLTHTIFVPKDAEKMYYNWYDKYSDTLTMLKTF